MTLTREQIAAYRAAQPALAEAMAQLHAEAAAEAANWPDKGRHETWAAISLAEYDVIAAAIAAHDALLDIAEAVQWIATSDRLPATTGIVIVYDAICGHARLFDFDAESLQGSFMQSHGFTHWMPLPVVPEVVLPLAGEVGNG